MLKSPRRAAAFLLSWPVDTTPQPVAPWERCRRRNLGLLNRFKNSEKRHDSPFCLLCFLFDFLGICRTRDGRRRLWRRLLQHGIRGMRPRRMAARLAGSQRVPGHDPAVASVRQVLSLEPANDGVRRELTRIRNAGPRGPLSPTRPRQVRLGGQWRCRDFG